MIHTDSRGLPTPCPPPELSQLTCVVRNSWHSYWTRLRTGSNPVRHVCLCFQPPVLSSSLDCNGEDPAFITFWQFIPSCHHNRSICYQKLLEVKRYVFRKLHRGQNQLNTKWFSPTTCQMSQHLPSLKEEHSHLCWTKCIKVSPTLRCCKHQEHHIIIIQIQCKKLYKKSQILPWLVWLSGLSASLRTKGLPVQFPVRAHAWVAGQVPSRGHVRGNHTLMFLSSFSLPSPLSKNK